MEPPDSQHDQHILLILSEKVSSTLGTAQSVETCAVHISYISIHRKRIG